MIPRKALRYLLALLLILTLNFLIPRLMPGDPLVNILGEEALLSPEQVARIRAELGLDLPLGRQYLLYWQALARLDLGHSYHSGAAVLALLAGRAGWTLLLVGPAVLLGAAAGALLGAAAGWRPGRAGARAATAAALVLYSMPPYFLALLLLYLLGFRLDLFPLKGYQAAGGLVDTLRHLALPVLVLSLFTTSRNFVVMRGSAAQEKLRPYVSFAAAKGLRDRQVLYRHAFWNASLPVLTVLALDFGFILSGALFVEIAFSLNGMGTLIYEALRVRDYPVLQGSLLLITVMVVAANLLVDLLYSAIDPRVRAGR